MTMRLLAVVRLLCVGQLLVATCLQQPGNLRLGAPLLYSRQQWLRYRRRMSNLTVHNQPLHLGFMQHDFSVARSQAERGLAFGGSLSRVQTFLKKLLALEHPTNLTVGAVLGPVSCNLAGQQGMPTWVDRVTSALQTANPRANFQVFTTCRNSAGPELQELEFHLLVTMQTLPDLVLLEPTSVRHPENKFMDTQHQKAFERVLRYLLERGDQRPPVIALHLLSAEQVGLSASAPPSQGSYIQTWEDVCSTTAQYYDVPWLSLRDALWLDLDPHSHPQPTQTPHMASQQGHLSASVQHTEAHSSVFTHTISRRRGSGRGMLANKQGPPAQSENAWQRPQSDLAAGGVHEQAATAAGHTAQALSGRRLTSQPAAVLQHVPVQHQTGLRWPDAGGTHALEPHSQAGGWQSVFQRDSSSGGWQLTPQGHRVAADLVVWLLHQAELRAKLHPEFPAEVLQNLQERMPPWIAH